MDATTKALIEKTRRRKIVSNIDIDHNKIKNDEIKALLNIDHPEKLNDNKENIKQKNPNKACDEIQDLDFKTHLSQTPKNSKNNSGDHSTPINETNTVDNWDISIIPQGQTEVGSQGESKIYPIVEVSKCSTTSPLKRIAEKKDSVIPRKSPRKLSSTLDPKSNIKCPLHNASYNSEIVKKLLVQAAEQQNIVLQTSQALNICYSSVEDRRSLPETIEAERLLLLSIKKREYAMGKVSVLKESKSHCTCYASKANSSSCKAQLKISNICIGITSRFLNNLHESINEYGKCYFVILVHMNDLFLSTLSSSILDIDQVTKKLNIPGTIDLGEIDSDFSAVLTLYILQIKSADVETPRSKMWKKIANNKSESSPMKPGTSVFRSSQFVEVGSFSISNESLSQSLFKICKLSPNIPLDGNVLIKIECLPLFECKAAGFLNLMDNNTSFWTRYWCVLDEKRLSYWAYPEDENLKPCRGFVDLYWVFDEKVSSVNRSICPRPHTFQLILRKSNCISSTFFRLFLAGDCREEKNIWISTFSDHLEFHKKWFKRSSSATESSSKNC